MINFVNTEIVEKGRPITVGVYYTNFQKAVNLIDKLKTHEHIIKEMKHRDYYEVIMEKDGFKVALITLPMSESSRGNRVHYSFIDKSSFNDNYSLEFLNTRILMSTVDYNMKDEYKVEEHYEPRLLLY